MKLRNKSREETLLIRVLRWFDRGLLTLAIVATVCLMFLVASDALSRYLLGRAIVGAYEIASDYLIVAVIFLSLLVAYEKGGFVRITMLVERLPPRGQSVCNALAQIISLATCLVLLLATLRQTMNVYGDGTISGGVIAYPMWPAYAIIVVGLARLCIRLTTDLPRSFSTQSPITGGGSPEV